MKALLCSRFALALFTLVSITSAQADGTNLMRMRFDEPTEKERRYVKQVALATPEIQDSVTEAKRKADESDEPYFLSRTFSLNFVVGMPEGAGLDLSVTPKFLGRYITTSIMASTAAAWWGVNGKVTLRVLAKKHVSPVVSVSFGHLQMTSYADQIIQMFLKPGKDGTKFEPGLVGQGFMLGKGQVGIDFVSNRFHFLIAGGIARQVGRSHGGRDINRLDVENLTIPAADLSFGGRF